MTSKKKNKKISFETNEIIENERIKNYINGIIDENISLLPKNDSQKQLIESINKNQITICNGVAGSGKTICSIAEAIKLLKNPNNYYQKILLVKSVTVLKNEELGFLKGDLREKIHPFLESFKLNTKKLFTLTNVDSLLESSIINFMPLAYIRGINLDNSIVLLDETQNVSVDNVRTLLTRIGKNSKIICLGDTNQIDLKNRNDSSLMHIMKIFESVKDFGCINMDENDENCRNPIIKTIEEKFKNFYESKTYKKQIING
jgi:phosphate starvation-inducible PhoH-like protein